MFTGLTWRYGTGSKSLHAHSPNGICALSVKCHPMPWDTIWYNLPSPISFLPPDKAVLQTKPPKAHPANKDIHPGYIGPIPSFPSPPNPSLATAPTQQTPAMHPAAPLRPPTRAIRLIIRTSFAQHCGVTPLAATPPADAPPVSPGQPMGRRSVISGGIPLT